MQEQEFCQMLPTDRNKQKSKALKIQLDILRFPQDAESSDQPFISWPEAKEENRFLRLKGPSQCQYILAGHTPEGSPGNVGLISHFL